MKKSIKFLFAAIAVLTVASCAVEDPSAPESNLRTIGVSFPELTKTSLKEFSPVWAQGDTLWLSNGSDVQKVGVPADAVGAKAFTFETTLSGDLYIVYPFAAAVGASSGTVKVKVPALQDGTFGSANICAGKVGRQNNVVLKNVTAVMKFDVNSDNIPVKSVCINAVGTPLAGTCDVTFSGDDAKVSANGTGTGVSIEVNGLSGEYYASVIPGKYAAGFSVTAVSTELSVETKTSAITQTVQANDLVSMGSIGAALKPLSGSGTEGDPYTVKSLGEWLALTYYVNEGNNMEGQYVKATADISGITMPVGIRVGNDQMAFLGNFDGDNHTLTVDINGANTPAADRLGLFGLAYGASIQNVTVAGSVTSTGSYIAGVVGVATDSTTTMKTLIKNCKNTAEVSGGAVVGGIAGYVSCKTSKSLSIEGCSNSGTVTAATNYAGGIVAQSTAGANTIYKTITGCTNSGSVNAATTAGGIVGYSYVNLITDNTNSGAVTTTGSHAGCYYLNGSKFYFASGYNNGVGGVAGWAQNSSIKNCGNTGEVTGVNKIGGVVGSIYWTPVDACTNSGTIVSTSTVAEPSALYGNPGDVSIAGGIVGWSLVNGNITNCENSGEVKGKVWVGGIVGYTQATTSGLIYVTSCTNKGDISGSRGVGGIVGRTWDQGGAKYISGTKLLNEGNITATDRAAGGIIGITYDSNSSGLGRVSLCVNKGNVTAPLYVGGIIGAGQARTVKGAFIIYTSENYGTVTATRSDDAGECAGGIIGCWATATTGGGIKIYNSNNRGDVLYRGATHVKPYSGGIVGRFIYGEIKNCYNGGKLGPEDGSEPAAGAEKYLGAIVGSLENTSTATYCYYLDTCCAQASGTNKSLAAGSATAAAADGTLASTVKVNDLDYTNVVDALNAWVSNPTGNYRGWKAGPVIDFGE